MCRGGGGVRCDREKGHALMNESCDSDSGDGAGGVDEEVRVKECCITYVQS